MALHFKKIKLTEEQKQIIIGTLLGDAHLESQTDGKTFRLRIMHSASQKQYLDWLYLELKDIAVSPPREKTIMVRGKQYKAYWFDTVSSGSFRFYANQFYPEGRKVIPKLIHRWMTPLVLAVWYMDDGSIKSHETKGRIINTQGFTLHEVKQLIECLSDKFNIQSRPRKQKEGWQIFIPAEMYESLVRTIGPHIIPSMKYKLYFNAARPQAELIS